MIRLRSTLCLLVIVCAGNALELRPGPATAGNMANNPSQSYVIQPTVFDFQDSYYQGEGIYVYNDVYKDKLDATVKINSPLVQIPGTLMAKEVRVTAGPFPDYVFSPDYRLATLPEVDYSLSKNTHLQGSPTAVDVAKPGVAD